ncbi:MAG: hypothetical protein ACKPEY_16490, partial [Planctomycetota bacterium]
MTGIISRMGGGDRPAARFAVKFGSMFLELFTALLLAWITAGQGRAAEKAAAEDERSATTASGAITGPLLIEPHARVVIVGNTLAERMQYYGHWETLLH